MLRLIDDGGHTTSDVAVNPALDLSTQGWRVVCLTLYIIIIIVFPSLLCKNG